MTPTTPTAPETSRPSAWLRVWMALLPAVYFLSPLAVFALPALRRLPRPVLWLLGAYALSQQVPALLAPDPAGASLLALARTLLMLGLIAAGALLGQERAWMGIGLACTYAVALGLTALQGGSLLAGRLTHPFMTSITLGLLGAAGLWVALFSPGRWWWRGPLGVTGAAVLLLTGSRGPLAAALVGAALGFAVRSGRRLALGLLAGAVLLGGTFFAGQQLAIPALQRLDSTDTSGRDIIWYNTLSVIHGAPLGGVGSYLLGKRLATPGEACTLWPGRGGGAAACPPWIQRLGQPWLIAHNVTLQQLAETGPLGLMGLFLLLGVTVTAAWRQRDALGLAVTSGLLLATANDNTLLVPGPFIGELFWITAGSILIRTTAASPAFGWAGGSVAAALLAVLSLPILGALRSAPAVPGTLDALIAPRTVSAPGTYVAYARFNLPSGRYRVSLRTCKQSCATVVTLPLLVQGAGLTPVIKLQGVLDQVPQQRLEMLLYPGQAGQRPQPLAQSAWPVRWTP